MISAWEERRELLAEMREAGAEFRLDERSRMSCRISPGAPGWIEPTIQRLKQAVIETLRHEAGMCIGCGMGDAAHPIIDGREQVFDEEGKAVIRSSNRLHYDLGYNEYVYKDAKASVEMHRRHPKLWCEECWAQCRDTAWLAAILMGAAPADKAAPAAVSEPAPPRSGKKRPAQPLGGLAMELAEVA